ncbi:MAG TPA: 6-pyruvoyl-tetrahydropterin synthase-related protein [Candidatus Acidoferrum sp.]|jgi:hypothetical protein
MTDSFDPAATFASKSAGPGKREWLIALLLSLATALAIVSPFLFKGNASGHDFSFHAASWIDAAAQWRDGIILPRWTDGANHGFGEPRFIFYPPISWIFGAVLSFIVPWIYVPAIFIVLTQTLAGLSAFALGRRLFALRGALLCTLLYAANPYALLIVYMRSDFAEQFAMIFFPLMFLVAMEVFDVLETPGRTRLRSIAFLAVTFAAVWVTNAPAGVVASYSLGALLIFSCIAAKSWRPALYGTAALILGLGIAGFYLVPAIHEQHWVNITQALASGLAPAQNFLYTTIADEEHNAFNRIASDSALLMVLLTAFFSAISYVGNRKRPNAPIKAPLRNALIVLSALSTFLMLRFSLVFWQLLPKLRFVQFPWRWMSILAIPFACFLAAGATQKRFRWYEAAAVTSLIIVILAGTAAYMVQHTWWDSEDVPTLLEAQQKDEGFEGVDEYDPAGDDHSSLPEKSPRVTLLRLRGNAAARDAKIHVEIWDAETKELRIDSREPVRLSLRLLNYPAWRVQVNDQVVAPLQPTGETNQMVLPLAAGSSHVVVQFVRTTDRTLGGALTILSILVLLFVQAEPQRL